LGGFEAGPAAVLLFEFILFAHHCSGRALDIKIAPIAPIPHNPRGRGRRELKPLPTSLMFKEPVFFLAGRHFRPIVGFLNG
jgi:hypothetical protein